MNLCNLWIKRIDRKGIETSNIETPECRALIPLGPVNNLPKLYKHSLAVCPGITAEYRLYPRLFGQVIFLQALISNKGAGE